MEEHQLTQVIQKTAVRTRDSNPRIPNPGPFSQSRIPGIPNPGIGDALIPGFQDYEKSTNARTVRKIHFSGILGAIPGSKAESERIRPQRQVRDQGGHRSTGAIVSC